MPSSFARHRLSLAFVVLAVGACRCGSDPSRPHAYDVGVPLDELPRSALKTAAELIPPDALLLAETSDLRALIHEAAATPEGTELAHAGLLKSLALTRTGSTLGALAQRLNDLSRAPMGSEVLDGVLDGPLTIAARANVHGSLDLLAVKRLPPAAKTALRLANMLEAVHPSAQQVRVERHRGIPVRHLRLDAEHTLYYFVLRDFLVLGTELGWVTTALDRALGDAKELGLSPALAQARARCTAALGFVAIDAATARDARATGLAGRAVAGLQWAALRYTAASGLELGLKRAHGAFHPSALHFNVPHGAAVVLAREVSMSEVLAVSPAHDAPLDAGADPSGSGRELLTEAATALDPQLGPHLLYALLSTSDATTPPRHALLFEAHDSAQAERALLAFAPRAFRDPLRATSDGAWCAGNPAALCIDAAEGSLGITSGAFAHHGWLSAKASAGKLEVAAAAAYIDLPLWIGALDGDRVAHKSPDDSDALHDLATALQGLKPRWVSATSPDGSPEAWGRIVEAPVAAGSAPP